MTLFKCPECDGLSTSNRRAKYFWCPCGHPLTAAEAVPEMVTEALAEGTPPPPPAAEEAPSRVEVQDEPVPEVAPPVVERTQRVSG